MHRIQFFFNFFLFILVNANFKRCYSPHEDFYSLKGSKTAYEFVHGNIKIPETTCTPLQVWMLARHGTRYPSTKATKKFLKLPSIRDEIIKNHKHGRGELCLLDLYNLWKWTPDPNLNLKMDQNLSSQGYKDHFFLAQRLKSAFPYILKINPEDVKPGDFVFRSTDTQRTKASLESFSKGLFGRDDVVKPEQIPKNDTLLHLYKDCPAWDKCNVNKESKKFKSGPEFEHLVKKITRRLGFKKKLDQDVVATMYDMCTFESAWYLTKKSPWCAIFTKKDGKIFEYADDLKYYYKTGPGRKMSKKLGCFTLNDMFNHFQKLSDKKIQNEPKGVFYFSHTTTLQALMSTFNIGKESSPILANNYNLSEHRNYRISRLGPFATNIIAIFYGCNETSSNKVAFFVSEKQVSFPGCEDGFCDWNFIKQTFGSLTQNCTTDFCYKNNNKEATVHWKLEPVTEENNSTIKKTQVERHLS